VFAGTDARPGRFTVDQVAPALRLTYRYAPVSSEEMVSGTDQSVVASLAVKSSLRPGALPATDQLAPPSEVARTEPDPSFALSRDWASGPDGPGVEGTPHMMKPLSASTKESDA